MNNFLISKFKELNYEKIYLYLTLSLAFVMPLSRAAISFFILALVLTWFVERDFKRKFEQIKASKVLVLIGIFYCVVLFSAIISSNIDTTLKFVRLYAYWIIIFVIATSLKKEYISSVITAFLLGMFISEIIAYGVFFDIWKFGNATKEYLSPFMMHIDYSVFLAFTSMILFNRIVSKDYSFKEKFFMFLFFCSTTGNLFLSVGRTGQVAFIFAIIVMFFLYYKLHIKTIIYSFLSLLIIFMIAFNSSDMFEKRVNLAKTDIEKIIDGDLNSSWGIRIAYWMISYEILKENPIFGVGIGDYKEAIIQTLEKEKFDNFPKSMKDFMKEYHVHNQFLMIIIQTGLIGIVIIILLFYNLLRISLSIKKEYKNIFVLFLVIYFISCIADPLWYKQFTLVLWILFVSLLLSMSSLKIPNNCEK
ncbi:MAG: O-antigen ligase family protein [Aliarcobacter sp.]|nr:O-antigen ligase family protein [Aliarcobacter sp.]